MDTLYAVLFILGLPLILVLLGLWTSPDGIVWIYRIVRDEQGRPRALVIAGIFLILVVIMGITRFFLK